MATGNPNPSLRWQSNIISSNIVTHVQYEEGGYRERSEHDESRIQPVCQ